MFRDRNCCLQIQDPGHRRKRLAAWDFEWTGLPGTGRIWAYGIVWSATLSVPLLLGIGVTVARLTLTQLVQVRILDPQLGRRPANLRDSQAFLVRVSGFLTLGFLPLLRLRLMFTLCLALLAGQPPAEAATHEGRNPLFKSLLETGLLVGPDVRAKFPAPTMPDGLDAAKQKAVVAALIGNESNFADFTRQSVVAPQLLKLRDVTPSDPKAPARGVDVWFVVHGDLKALDDEKFRDRVAGTGRGGKGTALTNADLAKRKIAVPGKQEGFGTVEFDFLDKVRVRATGRAVWSRTDDSVVVAAEIDPRFTGDADFPNQWQPLTKEGGKAKAGAASPWAGAGLYLKITRLAEPAGALFCEQHVVFAEPTGWFDGANLLRSKLPPVVQNNVRTMRKEWARGK